MMAFNKLTQRDIARLSNSSVSNLRIVAKDYGIRGYSRMRKSEIVEKIALHKDRQRKDRRNDRARTRTRAKQYASLSEEERIEQWPGHRTGEHAGESYETKTFWDAYKEAMGY